MASFSPGLLVLLRELSDFDCEGHRARSQDVDDAEVPELDVEAELLEEPAVPAGRHLGLILAVGAGAGNLPAAPDGGGGVGMAALNIRVRSIQILYRDILTAASW